MQRKKIKLANSLPKNHKKENSMTDKEKEELHQILSSLWKDEDSVSKAYYNRALPDVQIAIDPTQEESMGEDLEKAANEWDAKASFTPFYMTLNENGNPNGVRQDYTTHAESFKAGANWQKEQMIAKAIEGKVISNEGLSFPISYEIYRLGLEEGDKVKVIVIKED